MASLRQIRRRLRSVRNTQQITRAMQMVAASKLKRAENCLFSFRPYAQGMERMLNNLSLSSSGFEHPLLQKQEPGKVGLVVVTADKGLCGSYNSNIIRQAENFLNGLTPPRKGSLILLGRKGYDYFKRRQWEILLHVPELSGKFDRDRVKGLTEDIVRFFTSGKVSEVHLLYTKFISAMVYKPTLEKFLELEKKTPGIESGNKEPRELRYIYEPDFNLVWNAILPEYLVNKLYLVLTESATSEYSARMIAMKAATDNAEDMMEQLTLLRNKVRQATITRELSEIVAGAQAF